MAAAAPAQPTVFIVDDDASVRKATGLLLQAHSIASRAFDSADGFFSDFTDDWTGCVLLDVSMPGMSGIEVVERLRSLGAHLPVLIVSGTSNIPIAVQGMKLGAIDFLEKPVDPETLIQKVKAAITLDAERLSRRASDQAVSQRFAALTPREQEILKLLAKGHSTKQVAAALGIAVKTADNHRTKLMRKAGALNAADLIRLAMEAKLV